MDDVVQQASADRLPAMPALVEAMRRRRASGGPAERTFASLIGMELRPRMLREAHTVFAATRAQRGDEARDALWSHPDLLPGPEDLADPLGFVDEAGQVPDTLAGLDDQRNPESNDDARKTETPVPHRPAVFAAADNPGIDEYLFETHRISADRDHAKRLPDLHGGDTAPPTVFELKRFEGIFEIPGDGRDGSGRGIFHVVTSSQQQRIAQFQYFPD